MLGSSRLVVLRCAEDDDAKLKSLYDDHRWFELRDSITKVNAIALLSGQPSPARSMTCAAAKKFRDVFKAAAEVG